MNQRLITVAACSKAWVFEYHLRYRRVYASCTFILDLATGSSLGQNTPSNCLKYSKKPRKKILQTDQGFRTDVLLKMNHHGFRTKYLRQF